LVWRSSWATFNGNLNTGLILRTIRLKDSIAEVSWRYCPYDSVPEAEEQETLTKAAAMLEQIHFTKHKFNSSGNLDLAITWLTEQRKRVLLVDI